MPLKTIGIGRQLAVEGHSCGKKVAAIWDLKTRHLRINIDGKFKDFPRWSPGHGMPDPICAEVEEALQYHWQPPDDKTHFLAPKKIVRYTYNGSTRRGTFNGHELIRSTALHYAECMKRGDVFPPISVRAGRTAHFFQINDGCHRLAAAVLCGKSVSAKTTDGRTLQVGNCP